MKALVFDGKLSLRRIDKPVPARNEALIKILLAGICKTDIEIVKGYMNFKGVLGHEFVGLVEESANPDLIGKRVVGEINIGCGVCDQCAKGMERHCGTRSVLGISAKDGVFAEYVCLPESNLHVVSEKISDDAAVFTEPLAAAIEIMEQIHVDPSTRALIIGDGRLGLLICMVLRLTGCSITVLGKHPDKMRLFENYSAAAVHFDDTEKLDRKYDLVVEASGSPSGWNSAIRHVAPRGVIALKSTYHGEFNFNPAPLVINEITVTGSRCGPFAPALRLMESGLVDPTPLISEVHALEDSERAFEIAGRSKSLKILVRM